MTTKQYNAIKDTIHTAILQAEHEIAQRKKSGQIGLGIGIITNRLLTAETALKAIEDIKHG